MQKPNFFFLGAPKCGTTALAHYLSTHPEIVVSSPKEAHYFCKDLMFDRGNWRIDSDSEYIDRFFDGKNKRPLAIIDASVFYLYSKVAVENIINFNPGAKFIVMLRDPVKASYALFSQYSFAGWEVDDFLHAWSLQSERKIGNCIPSKYPNDKLLLLYKELFSYGEQIERLFGLVDKSNVLVITMDELSRNPRKLYLDVLAFLEVSDDGRVNFPRVNASRRINNRQIAQILRSKAVNNTANFFKKALGIKSLHFGRPEIALPASYAELLYQEFSSDINKLSELIDIDISHWYQ